MGLHPKKKYIYKGPTRKAERERERESAIHKHTETTNIHTHTCTKFQIMTPQRELKKIIRYHSLHL